MNSVKLQLISKKLCILFLSLDIKQVFVSSVPSLDSPGLSFYCKS